MSVISSLNYGTHIPLSSSQGPIVFRLTTALSITAGTTTGYKRLPGSIVIETTRIATRHADSAEWSIRGCCGATDSTV
jgi:hypothetical protein